MSETSLKRSIRAILEMSCEFYRCAPDNDGRVRAIEGAVENIASIVLETDLRLMDIERAEREAKESGYDAGLWKAREAVLWFVDDALGCSPDSAVPNDD